MNEKRDNIIWLIGSFLIALIVSFAINYVLVIKPAEELKEARQQITEVTEKNYVEPKVKVLNSQGQQEEWETSRAVQQIINLIQSQAQQQ